MTLATFRAETAADDTVGTDFRECAVINELDLVGDARPFGLQPLSTSRRVQEGQLLVTKLFSAPSAHAQWYSTS